MPTLSTHVLDTARGRPAAGILVQLVDAAGDNLDGAATDHEGRIGSLGGELPPGTYTVRFDLSEYQPDGFYPEVIVTFRAGDESHYHVPLLLSPFGYSTYRGS